MVWFKVDDGFHDHRKVRRLAKDKLAAAGLWTLCGSWSDDGFIPDEIVERFDPRHRLARRLVDVGLWVESEHDGEHGYRFHQWEEQNPTPEELEERRRKRAAAGRIGGINSGKQRRSKSEASASAVGSSKTEPRPVPNRPEPEGGRASATPPPPRCPRHLEAAADGPCGPCKDARLLREEYDGQQFRAEQERRAVIHTCKLCDVDGWRYEDDRRIPITPYVKCDHRPLRSVSSA